VTRFAVDLAEVESVVADMQVFEGRFEARLAELDELVARLHGTWTGAAAAAQGSAHARWKAGAEEMHRALVEMREAAQRAHANYSAAAETNTRMWAATR
jgi:WXG100 family type VII secretion target